MPNGHGWMPFLRYDEEQDRPQISWALVRRAWSYGRPYVGRIAGLLALILVVTVLGLAPPLLVRNLIDKCPAGPGRPSADPARAGHAGRPARQRTAGRGPALPRLVRRRGHHLRPPDRALRPSPPDVPALLHRRQDRGAHLAPEQRRHRRPAGGQRDARRSVHQLHHAGQRPGDHAGARVASDPSRRRRPAALPRPGALSGQEAPGDRAPPDDAQRRDERHDGRDPERQRLAAGEALRPGGRRGGPVPGTGGARARRGRAPGLHDALVLPDGQPDQRRRLGRGLLGRRHAHPPRGRLHDRHHGRLHRLSGHALRAALRADQRPHGPGHLARQLRAGFRGPGPAPRDRGEVRREDARGRPRGCALLRRVVQLPAGRRRGGGRRRGPRPKWSGSAGPGASSAWPPLPSRRRGGS